MATASVTITFVDGTTIEAADHNGNFAELVNFLNSNVVHVDGSRAMTGELAMGANKITGVADPTLAQDVATKAYTDSLSSVAHDHTEYADTVHVHAAADITSGTLNTARIPNLDASKVTSGQFSINRIPGLAASIITSGTMSMSRLPYSTSQTSTSDSLLATIGAANEKLKAHTGTGAEIIVSTGSPSGGQDGDVWLKV